MEFVDKKMSKLIKEVVDEYNIDDGEWHTLTVIFNKENETIYIDNAVLTTRKEKVIMK